MRHIARYALLFLAALIPVLAPGCGAPEESAARFPGSPTLAEKDFSQHLDISVGYWEIDEMIKAPEADAVQAYLEELFNVTFHPVSVTWSNYKERYQILMATDALPDVFATVTISSSDNNDSATFSDMIERGVIRPLPDDLSSYPLLKEVIESVPEIRYADGKYYAIPRLSFLDPILGATDAAMLVRRDWMDALGLDDPQSFEEFAEMTAAFAHQDPDGNGVDDTAGYNVNSIYALGKWVILGIAPDCNIYSWVERDGRYVPSWTTEEFEDVVAAYRTLYQSGGLDPNFYSKAPSTVLEDFASDRLGALEYKTSPASLAELEEKWNALNDKPFEECVDVLPIFPAPDGARYSNYSMVFWSESFLSSSVSDEKADRILSLFEYLLSDEGQMLCHFGIEGEDYELLEDGSTECLLDVGEGSLNAYLNKKYPSTLLFSSLAAWSGAWDSGWGDFEETELNFLRYGENSVRLGRKSALWYRDNTTQLTRPVDFLLYPKEATDQFSTYEALDAFINCIIGSGNPVVMWNAALDKMYENGLDEYIDRQNEAYREKS